MSKLAELYPHSVSVTRGAKGQYGWDIKVRFKESIPAEMAKVLSEIDAELKKVLKDEAR